ncbi:oxidase [Pseudotamlana carrageenivorans]|uniref:Oxidase n=1 Tax=Pseudotamlana carrageenivorans TaxID=2069432 RepID=A0A2I7SKQ8_9FLAO|nr:oxidase [Tamlana carrageenivorans]AUS06473.1 oxidase [Tamlana carrageenivorans]
MTDILIDTNNELIIENGDFVIGLSDEQHQKHIIIANKGEYKESPEVGVGIQQMLNNDEFTASLIEIKKQLEYDGMTVNNVSYNPDGKLFIDGQY